MRGADAVGSTVICSSVREQLTFVVVIRLMTSNLEGRAER